MSEPSAEVIEAATARQAKAYQALSNWDFDRPRREYLDALGEYHNAIVARAALNAAANTSELSVFAQIPSEVLIEAAAAAIERVQTDHWSKDLDLLNREHTRKLARAALNAAGAAVERTEESGVTDVADWQRGRPRCATCMELGFEGYGHGARMDRWAIEGRRTHEYHRSTDGVASAERASRGPTGESPYLGNTITGGGLEAAYEAWPQAKIDGFHDGIDSFKEAFVRGWEARERTNQHSSVGPAKDATFGNAMTGG